MKPRLLDLFCGAGGAAVGYARAGFEVVGVDIRPQPAYPFEFHEADALEYPLEGFDAVHASPPCQAYSSHVSSSSSPYAGTRGRDEPALIPAVLERLRGLRYVVENVESARVAAALRPRLLLCGTMLGLPIPRHRLFASSVPIPQPWHAPCDGIATRYALARGWEPRDMSVTGKGRRAGTLDRWRHVMGWPDYGGTQHGMREAIPPA